MWLDASLVSSLTLAAYLNIRVVLGHDGRKNQINRAAKSSMQAAAVVLTPFLALGCVFYLVCSHLWNPAGNAWDTSPVRSIWTLVSSASLVVPVYMLLMSQLPCSFTLGEGAVVSQGIAHLIASVTGDAVYPDRANDKQSQAVFWFVNKVCFWILAFAFFIWNALRRPPPRKDTSAAMRKPGLGGMDQGQTSLAREYDVKAENPDVQRPSSLGKQAAVEHNEKAASPLARIRSSNRNVGALVRVGISFLGAGASAVALSRQAYWVLTEFIPEWRGPRLAALTYWAALVGGAVPLMYFVQRAGAVPHILMRKGYHILALALFVPVLFTDAAMMQVCKDARVKQRLLVT